MTSTDTLLPCECGGKPRREHFPSINGDLWLCENSTVYSGTCRSRGSLSADFWNADRTPPTPATDVPVTYGTMTPTIEVVPPHYPLATDEREAVAQWCSGCHEVRSVDCYRAGCPKSDTERRAAEILAAEARGRDAKLPSEVMFITPTQYVADLTTAEANERARISEWLRDSGDLQDHAIADAIDEGVHTEWAIEHGAGK